MHPLNMLYLLFERRFFLLGGTLQNLLNVASQIIRVLDSGKQQQLRVPTLQCLLSIGRLNLLVPEQRKFVGRLL
jgi:hypothetical protein